MVGLNENAHFQKRLDKERKYSSDSDFLLLVSRNISLADQDKNHLDTIDESHAPTKIYVQCEGI